jgi:Na+/proline symporter
MTSPDGKELGFWMAGHVVYGICVIVANLVIAVKFNIHHHFSIFLIALMIIAYFFFFGLMALSQAFREVYCLFA